jgi:excinuclease UvrABC ATPase subunit
VIVTEFSYMDPITTHCETCDGRRFKESVLAHKLRGKSIADVLEMSAEEAAGFFSERALRAKLGSMIETGLGYLGLGQSLSTPSGGERQRIKLADRLSGTATSTSSTSRPRACTCPRSTCCWTCSTAW